VAFCNPFYLINLKGNFKEVAWELWEAGLGHVVWEISRVPDNGCWKSAFKKTFKMGNYTAFQKRKTSNSWQ